MGFAKARRLKIEADTTKVVSPSGITLTNLGHSSLRSRRSSLRRAADGLLRPQDAAQPLSSFEVPMQSNHVSLAVSAMLVISLFAPACTQYVDDGEVIESPDLNSERMVPVTDALELADVAVQITDIKGSVPIFLPDTLQVFDGDVEADSPSQQKPAAPLNVTGPSLYDSGEFTYKSGLWGTSYDIMVGRACPGYTRDSADAYAYNSNGGYCNFSRWYTQDPADCRFIVHVGASAYKNGTCAWSVYANEQGVFTYSATNTNSAQQNTTNAFIYLNAGQTLTAGTCGLSGASASGDTYLRLFDGSTQVAQNDDSCGGVSSKLVYTAPASKKYELRAGCFGGSSCGGTVVWSK